MSERRLHRVSPGRSGKGPQYGYIPCPRSEEVGTDILAMMAMGAGSQDDQRQQKVWKRSNHASGGFRDPHKKHEKCGPVSSSLGLSNIGDLEPPQPLVTRRPSSVALPRWTPTPMTGGGIGSVASGNNANNNNNNNTNTGNVVQPARLQPLSLATLDRDCFIIPVHSLDRFLPDGVPFPVPPPQPPDKSTPNKSIVPANNTLSVLEVADPKLCILAHLMSPLEAIDPILESPLARPILRQRAAASELLSDVAQANTAVGGMLLANMERNAEFPFIAYYVINSTQTDPLAFYNNMRGASLTKFDPRSMRYTAAHTLDLYSEVATICRPPFQDLTGGVKRSHTPTTGYIISVYKVFEGDDGERFERNWLYWTGARMLYRHLPRAAGLRRIALHKSVATKGDRMYLLVCECGTLLQDMSAAALLVPALRARLCGYTGLYRPIESF